MLLITALFSLQAAFADTEASTFSLMNFCVRSVHATSKGKNVNYIPTAEQYNIGTFGFNRVVTLQNFGPQYKVHVMREEKGGVIKCDMYFVPKAQTAFKLDDQSVKDLNGHREMPVAFNVKDSEEQASVAPITKRSDVDNSPSAEKSVSECDNSTAETLKIVNDALKNESGASAAKDLCFKWASRLSLNNNTGTKTKRELSVLFATLKKDPPDIHAGAPGEGGVTN